ncbi:MAG: PilZ domain-containing protein [Clostridia bacterium]|nr:PilZ domain-containing protein [Clostridia bacterium]
MADNRITIGTGKPKKGEEKEVELLKKSDLYVPETEPEVPAQEPPKESLDDNLWGNDWYLNKQVDPKYLAEKRLFVRVRYIQRIDCRMFCPSLSEEPQKLTEPFGFTVFDVSMGGIGAISEHPKSEGDILVFKLNLDHLSYEVKCEVVYSIPIDNVFRLGFRILTKDKDFIKHLKLFVARISLMGSKVTFQEIIRKYNTGEL